ncbi:hypothetical protein RBD99_002780 [Salmonella enterica]|nr:hypothetical protein [Salmonella enterica]
MASVITPEEMMQLFEPGFKPTETTMMIDQQAVNGLMQDPGFIEAVTLAAERDKIAKTEAADELYQEDKKLDAPAKRESRVGIVGGGVVGAGLLAAAADKLSRTANVNERAYLHNPFGFQNTDFGRESGKNSRRPMVTSAKGHPYPLPKSPRGVPRLGRTRGR